MLWMQYINPVLVVLLVVLVLLEILNVTECFCPGFTVSRLWCVQDDYCPLVFTRSCARRPRTPCAWQLQRESRSVAEHAAHGEIAVHRSREIAADRGIGLGRLYSLNLDLGQLIAVRVLLREIEAISEPRSVPRLARRERSG